MSKLLIIGAVVLIALLAFSFFVSSPDETTASAPTTTSETSGTIQDITADLRNRFDEFTQQSSSDHPEQNSGTENTLPKTQISGGTSSIKKPESQSEYYSFASGTDKHYTLHITPDSVPATLQATYHPPTETYTKGYTDSFSKTWKEVVRTVYSPQSRAEIVISDQSGRVIDSMGFAGKYSSELISKVILRSPEPYTITISGNHISLTLSHTS
ncbi:hypothetical protein [Methanorbis rubei]|uniref:Uncharacterized protein n=1 Tax=Methanorbis rubei TaxID=3028300 RepID=A0AAE4MFQ9_9EURY|nr:hypothetical protein [Methanocorpusculaceae archaeon Cs1]